jgi:hypothetical protein
VSETVIYALIRKGQDPRPFYIGLTRRDPGFRAREHRYDRRRSRRWNSGLAAALETEVPAVMVLAVVDGDQAHAAEQEWIRRARGMGWQLCNVYPDPSPEWRHAHSLRMKEAYQRKAACAAPEL